MKIRLAKHDDLERLHETHMNSIKELCAKDYSKKQIEAWAGRKLEDVLEKRNEGIAHESLWVLVEGESILGFSQMEPPAEIPERAYILSLYFRPEAVGKGWGGKLLDAMERKAKSMGVKEISLDSTRTSIGFYEKHGYRRHAKERDLDIGTCQVPCIPMLKTL